MQECRAYTASLASLPEHPLLLNNCNRSSQCENSRSLLVSSATAQERRTSHNLSNRASLKNIGQVPTENLHGGVTSSTGFNHLIKVHTKSFDAQDSSAHKSAGTLTHTNSIIERQKSSILQPTAGSVEKSRDTRVEATPSHKNAKQPPSPSVARKRDRGLTKSLLDQHAAYHEIDPADKELQKEFIKSREKRVRCNFTYNLISLWSHIPQTQERLYKILFVRFNNFDNSLYSTSRNATVFNFNAENLDPETFN